jgi:hypothetical protein
MNTIFGSRNLGSGGCTGEGDHKGFLTLNQHLTGLGRSPLRKTVFCRGDLHGRPRSEDAFHQVQP